jgi:hypothetical protein
MVSGQSALDQLVVKVPENKAGGETRKSRKSRKT